MSIYLYSVRAKTVKVAGVDRQKFADAHLLELLHTNWEGMVGDGDCPRPHALKQGAAIKYWEGQGGVGNRLVALKSDEKRYQVYRWTGKDCFWIDTDLIPGEFIGEMQDGILTPHECSKHPRRLQGWKVAKVVCGDGNCQKTLEPFPGEIEALQAREAARRDAEQKLQSQRDAIWAKAREQEKVVSALRSEEYNSRWNRERMEEEAKRLETQLKEARERIELLKAREIEKQSATNAAEATLENLKKVAEDEQGRLERDNPTSNH